MLMDKNGKYIKNARHISRRMHFVINGEEYNLHTTVCCQGLLQQAYIGTKNVSEDEYNPR